jgi:hypothetical protein
MTESPQCGKDLFVKISRTRYPLVYVMYICVLLTSPLELSTPVWEELSLDWSVVEDEAQKREQDLCEVP